MTDPRSQPSNDRAIKKIDLGHISRYEEHTGESFEPDDEALIFLNDDNEQTCHVEGPSAKAMALQIVEAVNNYESLKARVAELEGELQGIEQYGSDTLSGRVDGPDDRDWQREGVREMRDRARAALSHAGPVARDGER